MPSPQVFGAMHDIGLIIIQWVDRSLKGVEVPPSHSFSTWGGGVYFPHPKLAIFEGQAKPHTHVRNPPVSQGERVSTLTRAFNDIGFRGRSFCVFLGLKSSVSGSDKKQRFKPLQTCCLGLELETICFNLKKKDRP